MEGLHVQDDKGIMWQRDFTRILNSATCDASCGGFFTETISFTDSPMLFGSQEQAAATIPCTHPQQVRLPTIASRLVKSNYNATGSSQCLLSCKSQFEPVK